MLTDVRAIGLNAAVERINRFRKGRAKNLMADALRALAVSSANLLTSNITAGRAQPALWPGTLAKRKIGKEQGAVWGPIPQYGGSRPLYRSGALARSIAWMKRAKLCYAVGVQIGQHTAFSGGKSIPLAEIALMHETGFIHSVPITLRMQAYLRVLYGASSKPTGKHYRMSSLVGKSSYGCPLDRSGNKPLTPSLKGMET